MLLARCSTIDRLQYLDIQNLISGYATVMSGTDGNYTWNETALAKDADGKAIIPTSKVNEDGTLTYTI